MKKILLLICMFCTAAFASAQNTILFLEGGVLTVQEGVTVTTLGGIRLSTGAAVLLNGNLLVKDNVAGSGVYLGMLDTSTMPGTGTIALYSDKDVTIEGPAVSLPSLNVNNGGTAVVALNNNLTVRDVLTLHKGVVHTGSNRLVLQSNLPTSLVAGGGNSGFAESYITGNLRRHITTNDEHYELPVGKVLEGVRKLTFINQNLTGVQYLDVSFGPKNGTDYGLELSEDELIYAKAHAQGVWELTSNAVPASGNYILRASQVGFSALTDNGFALLLRPVGASNGTDWKIPLNSTLPVVGQAGRTTASGYAQRNGIREFGEFGLGLEGTLPVTLAFFKGEHQDDGSHSLHWETTLETGFDHFVVEHSSDARSFNALGAISSHHMQGRQSYEFRNMDPLAGQNYYRLKMVDADQSYAYSRMIALKGEQESLVYPNPLPENATLYLRSERAVRQANFYDARGTKVWSVERPGNEIGTGNLKPGLYMLQVVGDQGEVSTHKIVIQ